MKKLGFILMLSCIGFLGACSDDDKTEDAKDYAKEVESKYAGDLSVTVPLAGLEPIESKSNLDIAYAAKNKINLELKTFKISIAETTINVGDIILNQIDVLGNNNEVVLVEKEYVDYAFGEGDLKGTTATIKIKGKVVGKKADLQIEITKAMGINGIIKVTFKGDKNS